MTIIVINGKHYPAVHIEELSLRHTLVLQRELVLTNISSARSWPEVKDLVHEFSALPHADREVHPEALFLTALTIWAARVTAGEDITLLDAVDVPLSQVKFVAEPTDRKEPEGKGAPRAAGAKPKTSGKKSTSGSSS